MRSSTVQAILKLYANLILSLNWSVSALFLDSIGASEGLVQCILVCPASLMRVSER